MIGMQVGSTRKDRIGADSGGTDDALLEAQIGLQVAPPHCATPCNCKGIHHAKIRWNRSWNGFAARVQGTGKVRDRLCRVWKNRYIETRYVYRHGKCSVWAQNLYTPKVNNT
jgi:hypothetical protein